MGDHHERALGSDRIVNRVECRLTDIRSAQCVIVIALNLKGSSSKHMGDCSYHCTHWNFWSVNQSVWSIFLNIHWRSTPHRRRHIRPRINVLSSCKSCMFRGTGDHDSMRLVDFITRALSIFRRHAYSAIEWCLRYTLADPGIWKGEGPLMWALTWNGYKKNMI